MTSGPLAISTRVHRDRATVFQRLVDERLEAAYRLAAVLLGDRAAAEDATHDAIVRAWTGFGGLRDHAAFDGWFRRILVNCCRDIQRSRRARPAVSLDVAPPRPDSGADLASVWAERDALSRALDGLRHEHREVVVLRFYLDLPLEAIARATGAPLGTVKSRLHHALGHLRAHYEAALRPTRETMR